MIKVWMLRPSPHNINRIREFHNQNIIAIGWPELNSLVGKTKEQIKVALVPHPLNYTTSQLAIATSTVNSFVNEFRVDDIVVLPDEDDVYFCKIKSDYYYDPSKAGQSEGYPHQRKIEWIMGPTRRDDIPIPLRKSLRAPRALADLSHHSTLVLDFLNEPNTLKTQQDVISEKDYISLDYPLQLNKRAYLKIPKNISQEEAIRLGDFVKTLYFG